jgi:hypothetical protein
VGVVGCGCGGGGEKCARLLLLLLLLCCAVGCKLAADAPAAPRPLAGRCRMPAALSPVAAGAGCDAVRVERAAAPGPRPRRSPAGRRLRAPRLPICAGAAAAEPGAAGRRHRRRRRQRQRQRPPLGSVQAGAGQRGCWQRQRQRQQQQQQQQQQLAAGAVQRRRPAGAARVRHVPVRRVPVCAWRPAQGARRDGRPVAPGARQRPVGAGAW